MPRVFLSSTKIDLAPYREAAKTAIDRAECDCSHMDDWPAEDQTPYLVCMDRVDNCDLLVVIVGRRYGWIPPDQPKVDGQPGTFSITWLEVKRAREKGIPVLAFLMDDAQPALEEQWDDWLVVAQGAKTRSANFRQLSLAATELDQFRGDLKQRKPAFFTTPENLRDALEKALGKWLLDHKVKAEEARQIAVGEAERRYLDYLDETTKYIDLRGLKTGGTHAHRVEIEKLYVGLKSLTSRKGLERDARSQPLDKALACPRLVIQGDAGSGKTTFVRRRVRELVRSGSSPDGAFPLLIRVAELDQYVEETSNELVKTSHLWISRYLAASDKGLTVTAAERRLKGKDAVLFLDGLDEAVNETRRRRMVQLVEEAARVYKECRIVVTTRPAAYKDDSVLAGFELAQIEEWDDEGVNRFLDLWSGFLFDGDDIKAKAHRAELRAALDGKPEIRRMARNPVMLTALAVVHWNDTRLPEQRAELYESVLQWLAKAREQKAGRMGPSECLSALGRLAWGMQSRPGGRVTQLERGQAAPLLKLGQGVDALKALEDEELDSGIVVSRGKQVAFWHLTFLEYLAAREAAGFLDTELHAAVLRDARLYKPEWRETMTLLAGVLARQGDKKVNALFDAIASQAGTVLPGEARCVALLSAMARDLKPLKYEPCCERYAAMLARMRRLFEKGGGKGIDLETRVAAAEALGVDGHPAIYLPHQPEYWIDIAGGTFVMEETKDRKTVKAFRLGRNPVTVWEYGKFVEAGGSEPDEWEDQQLHPSRPVVHVDWKQANDYCDWAKVRLPLEEEWEWAARGKGGREWAWGNTKPDDQRANIDPWGKALTPVGMFPDGHTPEGLTDMSGNVWEWTASLYGKNDWRSLRGGSWSLNSFDARGGSRLYDAPTARSSLLGFRVAQDLSLPHAL